MDHDDTHTPGGRPRRRALTAREREILAMLARGMSGAEIATGLVISPETVRTHIRNAIAALGASTRSQAVGLAIRSGEIAVQAEGEGAGRTGSAAKPAGVGSEAVDVALGGMIDDLCALHDIDAGFILLAEEGGLSLRLAALGGGRAQVELADIPRRVALGDGRLGRVALDRRPAVLAGFLPELSGSVIAAPMVAAGQLIGVVALATRASRPVGRAELLILRAFADRVGAILRAGGDPAPQLARTVERFGVSWSTASGGAP